MFDAFLWNLRQGDRAQTYIVHGPTVIAIARRPNGGRDIVVDMSSDPTRAVEHALALTGYIENQGLRLDQVYGCRGSADVMYWMTRAREHNRSKNRTLLHEAVDALVNYITRHGMVLNA